MTSFGVQLPAPDGAGTVAGTWFEEAAAMAVRAERAGFDSVWVGDHPGPTAGPGGPVPGAAFDAYTVLGALASRTRRVRLGAVGTAFSDRNPGLLAKVVTTLDLISGGRAVLGVGNGRTGDGVGDHPGGGAPVPGVGAPDDGVRRGVVYEGVQVCRALLTGDDVTFLGTFFRLQGARNRPGPVQPGGPRILVGADGDPGILPVAARYADRCGLTGGVDAVAADVGRLRRCCAEIGRDPDEVGVTWRGPLPGPPGELPGLVAGYLDAGVDEVILRLRAGDSSSIPALGRALGLGDR